ncbi:MAG: hypothetical protein FIB01_00610 [Gemmatimonadetes bacterium]|nr:hypothetical protein [Gemmatimonadota bacterium]
MSADAGGLELAPLIGAKAASLGECARVLGPAAVPAWFVITDHAFRQALRAHAPGDASPVAESIATLLSEAHPRQAQDWDRLAARIRQLWRAVVLPPPLEAAILAGYRGLAAGGAEPFVAVRSSALEEDSPDAAWAGQFDTYLCIRGERAMLEHVRLAWAGLWSSRALQQRHVPHALPPHAGGGIIVQRMLDARVAGVVQTVCAASGRLRELVINAALGLGEGVVTGTVGVDEIRVHKPRAPGTALQLQYRVGDKRECIRFDATRGSGTRRETTLYHQRLRAALEYTEIEALVQAVLALEAAWQEPLDIEFAFGDHQPCILQARPIPLFHAALRETIERLPLSLPVPSLQPELIP